jgi:uncharacterized protein (TIGR02001 family)
MNKTQLALAAALISSVSSFAHAADAAPAPAPTPDWTITGNVALSSDYRFRGISQTDKRPSFSGGFDVAHSSGFYVGNWNSNIDADFFQGGNIEMDFYGGYKGTISDVGYDVGAIYYYYPGSGRSPNKDSVKNTELYVGASYGPVSAKFYYPLGDFFNAEQLYGGKNAGGSYYVDLSGAYDLGSGFGVNAHVGYQKLKGAAKLTEFDGTVNKDYVDWKLGVTYGFSNGFTAAVSYIDTNRSYPGATGHKVSNGTGVVSLSKTF